MVTTEIRCRLGSLAALVLLLAAACPAEPARGPAGAGDPPLLARGDASVGGPSAGDAGDAGTDRATDGVTDSGPQPASGTPGLVLPAGLDLPAIPAAAWVPRAAPAWAREPSGRVVELAGRRALAASDCVKGLGNPALARAAAGNRARARLGQVLASVPDAGAARGAALVLEGVEIDQVWSGARGVTCARAVLPLAPQGMTQ